MVIYIYLHKAFDKVDHGLLLAKLGKLGVRDPLLSCFASYLSGRSQIVKINNSYSKTIKVLSGFKSCKFLLFAYDMKLYMPINSPNNTISLQHDLDRFSNWCSLNGMALYTSKV